jgi:phosphoserine phosphatase RsbU/P
MPAPAASTPLPLSDSARDLLRECSSTLALTPILWAIRGEEHLRVYPPVSGELPGQPPTEAVVVPFVDEWELALELRDARGEFDRPHADLVASLLAELLSKEREISQMSGELAERYEEITLLYSISEILGSVISLEEAAQVILSEVIGTLGARRAALWIEDEKHGSLHLLASVGYQGQEEPISLDDPGSVTADVFRTRQPVIMDPADVYPRGEHDTGLTRRGYFLSVPVSYTPPQGEPRTVGVINLVGRTSDEPFTAGDLQLVAAIASQVGAAVENGRLVQASLRQQRVMRELELAHDLQLKLLPSAANFADYAEVSARCVPADSVGGDFYNLFRLHGGRMGVLVGDVSSHGFSAALIMALTMSAVAINASDGDPPAEVLRRTHRALIEELETTEMFVTLVYAVIDPVAGTLTYANAGHHHAFRVTGDGAAQRLEVTNPPLGMVDLDGYTEASTAWTAGKDLLFLFTDGLPDSLGRGEREGERILLDIVRSRAADPVDAVLNAVFDVPDVPSDVPADDRTAVLARIG